MTQDKELMHDFINGNKKSYSLLIEKYKQKLFFFILNIVKNNENTKDALQETFLLIYTKKHLYKADASTVATWFYAIAKNCALLELKKIKKHKNLSIDNHLIQLPDDSTNKKIENEFNSRALFKQINTLKPIFKQIILLKDIEGLNYKEISNKINTPISTCKGRNKRAKYKLKIKLKNLI